MPGVDTTLLFSLQKGFHLLTGLITLKPLQFGSAHLLASLQDQKKRNFFLKESGISCALTFSG